MEKVHLRRRQGSARLTLPVLIRLLRLSLSLRRMLRPLQRLLGLSASNSRAPAVRPPSPGFRAASFASAFIARANDANASGSNFATARASSAWSSGRREKKQRIHPVQIPEHRRRGNSSRSRINLVAKFHRRLIVRPRRRILRARIVHFAFRFTTSGSARRLRKQSKYFVVAGIGIQHRRRNNRV
jgi:hypothetical protein